MNLRPNSTRFDATGSHTPLMTLLVEFSAARAYALPRLPAPIMRMRGAVGKVCFLGAERKAVGMSVGGMAEGDMVGKVSVVLLVVRKC